MTDSAKERARQIVREWYHAHSRHIWCHTCKSDLVERIAAALPHQANTASEAWRIWFERLGVIATADVVNATATLVIAERQLAQPQVDAAAAAREIQQMYRATNECLGYEHYEPAIEAVETVIQRHCKGDEK